MENLFVQRGLQPCDCRACTARQSFSGTARAVNFTRVPYEHLSDMVPWLGLLYRAALHPAAPPC